jgi:D-glycero-D-manno-heptose 1,7-bisphosphate phosphatase
MNAANGKPAVFLDRDNTLIEDPGYLRDPAQVRLLDGVAGSLWRLRQAGYEIVVASNQSGVARGLITEEQVQAVNDRMRELLRSDDADVDAIYYCPHLDGPEAVVEEYRRESDLRKPAPGMLLQAATERGLDLHRSWMIGDSPRDVQAGRAAGCRTIMLGNGTAQPADADKVVSDLPDAVEYILVGASASQCPQVEKPAPPPTATIPSAPIVAELAPPPNIQVEKPEPPTRPATQGSRSDELMGQILEELRVIRRERQHHEFSIGQLAGAIAQAFAVCATGWGLYAAVNSDGNAATIRLLAAIVFQLAALTWFSAGRQR